MKCPLIVVPPQADPLKVSLFQKGIQEVMKAYSSEVLESMKKHQRGNNRQDIFRLLGKVIDAGYRSHLAELNELLS